MSRRRPLLPSLCLSFLAAFSLLAPANASEPSAPETAQKAPAELVEFLSFEGCAIGPATRAAALAEGFSASELDALAARARKVEGTVATGDWIVLAPSLCTMRPPRIDSEWTLDTPRIQNEILHIEANDKIDRTGCYFSSGGLIKKIVYAARPDQE